MRKENGRGKLLKRQHRAKGTRNKQKKKKMKMQEEEEKKNNINNNNNSSSSSNNNKNNNNNNNNKNNNNNNSGSSNIDKLMTMLRNGCVHPKLVCSSQTSLCSLTSQQVHLQATSTAALHLQAPGSGRGLRELHLHLHLLVAQAARHACEAGGRRLPVEAGDVGLRGDTALGLHSARRRPSACSHSTRPNSSERTKENSESHNTSCSVCILLTSAKH